MMAHPTDAARRYPSHQSEIGYTLGYHRAGRDKGITANCMTAQNRRVRTDGRPTLDQCWAKLILPWNRGARIDDISKNTTGAAKDVVLECHALIKAHVILNLAIIANYYARPNHYVLPDRAILTDLYFAKDVTEVPDPCAFPDLNRLIDVRALVDKNIREALTYIRHDVHTIYRATNG